MNWCEKNVVNCNLVFAIDRYGKDIMDHDFMLPKFPNFVLPNYRQIIQTSPNSIFKQSVTQSKFHITNTKRQNLNTGGSIFYMILKPFKKASLNGLNSLISFHRVEHELVSKVIETPNQINLTKFLSQNLKQLRKLKKINDPIEITFSIHENNDESLKFYECVQLNNRMNNEKQQSFGKNEAIRLQRRELATSIKEIDGFFNWESNDATLVSLNTTSVTCQFYSPAGGMFAILARVDEGALVIF